MYVGFLFEILVELSFLKDIRRFTTLCEVEKPIQKEGPDEIMGYGTTNRTYVLLLKDESGDF